MSLFLCHPPITRPAACGRWLAITLEWEQRKKRRVGGGTPCESRKTVFCVPSPVANQASAWLLGDVAEGEVVERCKCACHVLVVHVVSGIGT